MEGLGKSGLLIYTVESNKRQQKIRRPFIMPGKYDILRGNEQDPQRVAQFFAQELVVFLSPFLQVLHRLLDKRLVDTCLQVLIAMIRFRNMKQGLKLSE